MPLTFTVLNQQVGNGKFTSSSAQIKTGGRVPDDPATGLPVTQIAFSVPMGAADIVNPANHLQLTAEASWDNGVTWSAWGPFPYVWDGGVSVKNPNGVAPSYTGIPIPVNADGVVADRIRASLDTLTNALNAGLTVTLSS